MKRTTLLVLILAFTLSVFSQNSENASLYASNKGNYNFILDKDGNKNVNNQTMNIFEVEANSEKELNVKFNIDTQVEEIYLLSNQSNVIFKSGKFSGKIGSSINIPIEDLESGTYFVRVKTSSGIQVQRIIISK